MHFTTFYVCRKQGTEFEDQLKRIHERHVQEMDSFKTQAVMEKGDQNYYCVNNACFNINQQGNCKKKSNTIRI